jgi:hypothetical protein
MDVRKCAKKMQHKHYYIHPIQLSYALQAYSALTSRWLFWEHPTPQALPYTYLGFSARHWEHIHEAKKVLQHPAFLLEHFSQTRM